jgi:hypothetical protein
VPTQVITAIQNYLTNFNANHGGAFLTSLRSDEMIARLRLQETMEGQPPWLSLLPAPECLCLLYISGYHTGYRTFECHVTTIE